ncbi:MAG: QcrA and Rieske domain-containing protein [Candidatus Xenobia bacterium]
MSQSTEGTENPTPESKETLSRKKFFELISFGMGGAAGILLGVPVVSFMVAPLLEKPVVKWRAVGAVDSFSVGTTTLVKFEDSTALPWSGVSAHTAAWLRRVSTTEFTAFSVNCTHLGCPVRWLAAADLFMCPCHGGVYYANGDVAAGPPPRPLPQYDVRVRNNQVEIAASPVPISTD